LAIWQRLPDRFERFPAHHNDMSGRHFPEPLEIFRQMPGNTVAVADHPVERHRGDRFERFHNAHGIRTGSLLWLRSNSDRRLNARMWIVPAQLKILEFEVMDIPDVRIELDLR
jgi:hypothetical protein